MFRWGHHLLKLQGSRLIGSVGEVTRKGEKPFPEINITWKVLF